MLMTVRRVCVHVLRKTTTDRNSPTTLNLNTTMPRKRTKPQTDNTINDNAKLARDSPTPSHETRSPYFNTDGSEVAQGSQGEEQRARTRKRRVLTEKPSEEIPPITLPQPALPSPAQSLPVQSRKPGRRLTEEFFDQECVTLAKALLGKVLVRMVGGQRVSARMVETEGYLGGPDVASHSSGGKRTPRNEPMYMKPGTAYVYSIYGMYHCFNVSSREDGSCVLVRAAEPLEGLEVMMAGRGSRRGANAPPLKPHQLCNGPSKLCQALALTKESANKLDLAVAEEFWVEEELEEEIEAENGTAGGGGGEGGEVGRGEIEGGETGAGGGVGQVVREGKTGDGAAGGESRGEEGGGGARGVPEDKIVVSSRVGIDSCGEEWAKKPLRFYVLGNKCVSVRDKAAEKAMLG